MSRMLRLELVGLVLLACTQILTEHRDSYGPRNQYGYRGSAVLGGDYPGASTREVEIKYGRLRGSVVQPRAGDLPLVDVFLGVPYAQPPVDHHRFEPPSTQSPWSGVRDFVKFAPVCPQVLPNTEEEVEGSRHRYLKRLRPYLLNQSEDCLYLNIYAPHQNGLRGSLEKYPVMVFIHGESYEWNSGNPYDGTVLAAYGNVVFVTVNFRLGILGFLRPGTKDDTASNFGLLDQIAALVWLKDNIDQFGGDPRRITLLGHGTGAVFVNLLLLSPVEDLFKRAILMSGSALNPDAIGKAPLQITKRVAFALNCQNEVEDLANCLKNRTVEDLLNVKMEDLPKYVPLFAPLVDYAIIPDTPSRLMRNADRLGRFDLMYGVTELEKFHILPGVALLDGLDDARRDEFIRDSVKATHELESDLILRKVLEHYKGAGSWRGRRSTVAERKRNRDLVLEVASDSGVVAPMIATANLHSRANPKSYMYVFSHLRSIRDKDFNKQIRRTVHGEELSYVLGVPLDGERYHLSAAYDKGEAFLSKAMMDWWCNFAYSGNPNNVRPPPRRLSYLRNDYKQSLPYEIDWPEYDPENQMYFNLTTPPQIGQRYRAAEMEFWNEVIPNLLRRPKAEQPPGTSPTSTWSPTDFRSTVYGQDLANGTVVSSNESSSDPANIINKSDEGGGGGTMRSSSVVSMVIGFGLVFLLINATMLVYLYHKRQRMRKKASTAGNLLAQTSGRARPSNNQAGSTNGLLQEAAVAATLAKKSKAGKAESRELGYCNSASKPDIRELIKNDKAYDNNSNFGRRSRENSSSTIDTRIKVREWIQQEIVHRCSPRFLRKTRETLQREHREKLMKQGSREAGARRLGGDDDDEEAEAPDDESRRRLYDGAGQIRVRPGPRRQQKVSVAVDATPAARTHSVLNQVPIELARIAPDPSEYHGYDDAGTVLGTSEYCEPAEFEPNETDTDEVKGGPNIVVIEHHHSRSDPLPMDKIPSYGASKAISTAARINESDSGSASSLYAKINPKKKSRLPIHHNNQPKLLEQEPTELEMHSQPMRVGANGSTTLPRLLTFGGGTPRDPPPEVNVTSRDAGTTMALEPSSNSHEEALRTIRRRNYPKVLPDIEKRRSLPPNASFVIGTSTMVKQPTIHRQAPTPPSPPPRLYGTSRSLDCVEDEDEDEEEEDGASAMMPVTTNLHVGPLRKKADSVKNQSVPSLTDASESTQLSSATSMPVCPVHGSKQNIPGARSEPRILITPYLETNHLMQPHYPRRMEEPISVDQPDCSQRLIPERGMKLPRIIIKPTTGAGTMPRTHSSSTVRTNKPSSPGALPVNLHDNETYQRLLARREKMPLPGEHGTRIPQPMQRVEVIQRVNVTDAAATKL